MKKLTLALAFMLALSPIAAQAKYAYIHNEGEYSVTLPDAPTGTTIWPTDTHIPYIDYTPSTNDYLGEYATLHRTDPNTGEFFDVQITFLKATPAFLGALTKEKIQNMLHDDYKDTKLDGIKETYSAGAGNLKWAMIGGFAVDKSNHLLYNASNFMVGTDSIEVVKVQYSVENTHFNEDYKTLAASLKYVGK